MGGCANGYEDSGGRSVSASIKKIRSNDEGIDVAPRSIGRFACCARIVPPWCMASGSGVASERENLRTRAEQREQLVGNDRADHRKPVSTQNQLCMRWKQALTPFIICRHSTRGLRRASTPTTPLGPRTAVTMSTRSPTCVHALFRETLYNLH